MATCRGKLPPAARELDGQGIESSCGDSTARLQRGAVKSLRLNPGLLRVEVDRQLRAAGRGRPIRRSVWPVVSRTGCRNSHSGLIERCSSRRVDNRRILFEFSRFIDADMHCHVVSMATRVTLFRIRSYIRRRSRDRFRCATCPSQGNLLPRVDRIAVAERGCGRESKPGDAAERRGIQSIRTRRRPDGDLRRRAIA